MAPTPISLGTRSNPGRDGAISAARLINCYAEDVGDEGKIRLPIVASDGFTSAATITDGAVTRALLSFSDTAAYGVSGQKLFKLSNALAVTVLATYATSGLVTMARNRKEPNAQIAVCSSDGLVRIIENDSVSTPTIPDGSTFISVSGMDGYFIFVDANGEWFVSGIDTDVIDELAFAKAEKQPDGLMRSAVRGSDLALFGTRSIEFWQNTGQTDFPFERTTSVSIGCYAAGSVREVTAVIGGNTVDTIAFAATGSQGEYIGVFILDGYSASKISTHAVDRSIRLEGTSTANIKAFTWAIDGHVFYCITGSTFTWVYDTVTGLWHERASSALNRWRINDAMAFAGKTIVGDYTLGVLYEMSPSVVSASASTVSIQTSRDNGDTYTTARSKTISSSNRKQRFKWNRLGQSKEDGKVLKITMTNAVNENGTGVTMTVIPPHIHAWPNPTRLGALYVDVVPGSSTTSRPKAITGLAVEAQPVGG
jgi:hypothetical protein